MRKCNSFICLIVSFWLATTSQIVGQEWTRFRGPNGTGVANSDSIPVKWTEKDYNWKVKVPGVGHSSPVLWGDKIFLLSADPETATRHVLCYDAKSGKQTWVRNFESKPHHLHPRSSYASCTPAVDEERVYVGWSTPEETLLKAFDHNGKEVWSVDLGRWQSQHGFGTSPIVYKDLVILHNSQQANQLDEGEKPGESYMMAFDRETGKEEWRVPLKSMNVCYSVPFIYEPPNGGKPELVCTSTGNGMFSLDPLTGKENWSLNNDLFKMRTVASPILAGGLILGSTGSGGYSGNYVVAVRPGKNPEVAYELSNKAKFKAPYVPCYLAKGDLVFFLYDRGFVSCVDAPSGKIHTLNRVNNESGSPANFSGSPVRVGDRIYTIDEDGVVFVFAADKSFEVLAENPLGEASRATPAVAGGRMYLRTYSHLISIGG
jgi:outer membrane protein assembly factor BamB